MAQSLISVTGFIRLRSTAILWPTIFWTDIYSTWLPDIHMGNTILSLILLPAQIRLLSMILTAAAGSLTRIILRLSTGSIKIKVPLMLIRPYALAKTEPHQIRSRGIPPGRLSLIRKADGTTGFYNFKLITIFLTVLLLIDHIFQEYMYLIVIIQQFRIVCCIEHVQIKTILWVQYMRVMERVLLLKIILFAQLSGQVSTPMRQVLL